MPQLNLAFDAIARDTPELPALVDGTTTIDYATLAAMVRRAAGSLRRAGLAPGDMVGLSVRAELPRLVLQLGLMRLGCTSVTLASFEPVAARADLARRCGAVAVVSDPGVAHDEALAVIVPDLEAIRSGTALEREGHGLPLPDGAVAAVVLTSSGTTGKPKLIRRTQAQLLGYDQAEWPPRAATVSNMASPAESNAWTWVSLANLVRRRKVVFLAGDEAAFPEACGRAGVTKTFVWPARLPDLAARCGAVPGGSPLRDTCVLTGGSPVAPELQRTVLEHVTPHLVIQYGATEAGVVTWLRADPDRFEPGAVGYPMPGFELAVFDDDGRRLPAGETGFVRIRSLWTATEYWQDEEATARAFVDGWWQPGDLGRLDADGLLTFAGRGDDMMVMNSINIFPAEIERVAAAFPAVAECAAFPVAAPRYGQLPVLAVVAGPGFDAAALMAHCRERLGVRAPRKIVTVDALPRNTAGKVLLRELSERFALPG
jgi:acyl-CoA synthetase (AMP-forming)/AMP-acid ligase II